MKRRLIIITEIISPYRIPLFNALAQHPDLNLHVIFLGENDPNLRKWRVYKEEIRFSFQVLRSWRKRLGRYNALLNVGVASALAQVKPDVILCGGYSYLASWVALGWARKHAVPFLLWSESNQQDQRRGFLVTEFLKRQFLRRCDRFVVPGQSAGEYLSKLNIPEDRISIAPNAVDNCLFGVAADVARKKAGELRNALGLPSRYYLFVGRLVREKGIFDLLTAYQRISHDLRSQIGLVFVGDGPCKSELQQKASEITGGSIRVVDFVQRDELGAFYGLAETFVLPTYTDTWGMVVNEAMACGLPVIVSNAAGCAADLVRENWNGLSVKAGDIDGLSSAMTRLGQDVNLRQQMEANSAAQILGYSPEVWATSVDAAVRNL